MIKQNTYQMEVEEDLGSRITVNFGPSHPSTHGTLRLIIELDGETITRCEPEIGFLHTGFEKLGEYRNYNQFIAISDRMNYISPLNNNIGFAVAVEDLLGIEIPRRAQVIRVVLAELSRVADHILCIGLQGMDLGAFSVLLWAFVEREKLYDIFEMVTGTRLTTSYTRVGGLAFDVPDDFEDRVKKVLVTIEKCVGEIEVMLSHNRIFIDRCRDVGCISLEDALNYGITGPIARASGMNYDVRKATPYLIYKELDFIVPVETKGDGFARYLIRLEEVKQSISIIKQALKLLTEGNINYFNHKKILPDKNLVYSDMESLIHHFKVVMPGENHGINPPVAECYSATESPNGELGFHIVSDGTSTPYRIRVRPPSLFNYAPISKMMINHFLADLPAVLSTLNVIAGELDR